MLTLDERLDIRDNATYTRAEYEAQCAAHDVPLREDRHMRSIVEYNSDGPTLFNVFAAARLRGLQAEAAAQPARPVVPRLPVVLIEADCGHSVPAALLMNASHGTSCPDCYDRLSGQFDAAADSC